MVRWSGLGWRKGEAVQKRVEVAVVWWCDAGGGRLFEVCRRRSASHAGSSKPVSSSHARTTQCRRPGAGWRTYPSLSWSRDTPYPWSLRTIVDGLWLVLADKPEMRSIAQAQVNYLAQLPPSYRWWGRAAGRRHAKYYRYQRSGGPQVSHKASNQDPEPLCKTPSPNSILRDGLAGGVDMNFLINEPVGTLAAARSQLLIRTERSRGSQVIVSCISPSAVNADQLIFDMEKVLPAHPPIAYPPLCSSATSSLALGTLFQTDRTWAIFGTNFQAKTLFHHIMGWGWSHSRLRTEQNCLYFFFLRKKDEGEWGRRKR